MFRFVVRLPVVFYVLLNVTQAHSVFKYRLAVAKFLFPNVAVSLTLYGNVERIPRVSSLERFFFVGLFFYSRYGRDCGVSRTFDGRASLSGQLQKKITALPPATKHKGILKILRFYSVAFTLIRAYV